MAVLAKYIRNKNGHPYGVVVAMDSNHVGWSLCHVSGPNKDLFRKDKALMIAEGRALNGFDPDKVPQSIKAELLLMKDRAERYFQGAQV